MIHRTFEFLRPEISAEPYAHKLSIGPLDLPVAVWATGCTTAAGVSECYAGRGVKFCSNGW